MIIGNQAESALMSCRLYLNQPLHTGELITLPANLAHYLRQVMRHEIGDEIILFNGLGCEFHATIKAMSKQEISCQLTAFDNTSREMSCRIHVVQAACRSEKIETVLQKGTELGAASFHITRSERSSLKLDAKKLEARLERWRKIIVEAAEQSGRTTVPELTWHTRLADIDCRGLGLALHPHTAASWQQSFPAIQQSNEITLAIGPEGGWSDVDMSTLISRGFSSIVFGPRILRTETAAPALLAAIQAIRDN